MKLKILTFNAGLFRIHALGRTWVEPAAHTDLRFSALASAIEGSGADIVCLQEVYGTARQKALAESLRGTYPLVAPFDRNENTHGLMVLSQRGLQNHGFTPFRDQAFTERLFVRKGFLRVQASVYGGHDIIVTNTHLVAGGLGHPESSWIERIRSRQIDQIVATLRERDHRQMVLAGDFNAGPEASAVNYQRILDSGFRDAVNGAPPGSIVTWDPKNSLVQAGPHRDSPAQRCDHVFVHGKLHATDVRRIFQNPDIAVGFDRHVPLSDHYAIMATLNWS